MFSNTYFYVLIISNLINTEKIKWSVVGQRISAVEARMTDTPSPDPFPTLEGSCVCPAVSRATKAMTTTHPCLERPPLHTRHYKRLFNYPTDHTTLSSNKEARLGVNV